MTLAGALLIVAWLVALGFALWLVAQVVALLAVVNTGLAGVL
jgi:hypothetical protein